MAIKVTFFSVMLDGKITFGKAANDSDIATFYIKHGAEKYRMVLFADANEKNPYTRMKTCVEKGFLEKGKPIWVEAEMSYYDRNFITDDIWEKLIADIPKQKLDALLGGSQNPTKGRFPQFKVINWDFAIPKDCLEGKKEEKKDNSEKDPKIKPLNVGSSW